MPMEIQQESKDDVVILTPKPGPGENDRQSIMPLRNELNRIVVEGYRKVAINLEHIDMVTSSEIGTLIGCFRGISERDGALIVCGLRLRVIEILAITKMLAVFPIRVTLNEAVVELSKLKVAKGISNRMVQANPTLEQMRQWWDQVTHRHSRPAQATPPEAPAAEEPSAPAPEAPPEPMVAAVPVTTLLPAQEAWLEALDVVAAIRGYCARRGIPFTMDLTPRELLARVAEELTREE